jgi:cell division protein FtsL
MNSEKEEIDRLKREIKLLKIIVLVALCILLVCIIFVNEKLQSLNVEIENLKMEYDNFSNQIAKGIVDYTLSDEFLLNIQDSIAKLGVLSSNTLISFVKGCCKGLCCCGIGR